MKSYCILLVTLLLVACTNSPTKEETSEKKDSLKPVNELSYSEIVNAVISGEGEGVEYHGEPINQEAVADLKLEERESCGDNNCGKMVYLVNSGEKLIKATLHSPFKVAEIDSHTARLIEVQPGQSIAIACSHFCYAGEAYQFNHRIAGGEYLEE